MHVHEYMVYKYNGWLCITQFLFERRCLLHTVWSGTLSVEEDYGKTVCIHCKCKSYMSMHEKMLCLWFFLIWIDAGPHSSFKFCQLFILWTYTIPIYLNAKINEGHKRFVFCSDTFTAATYSVGFPYILYVRLLWFIYGGRFIFLGLVTHTPSLSTIV